MDDTSGAVGGFRALVENVGLIAVAICDPFGVLTAKINSTVGIMGCPKFDPDFKILVALLADQPRGPAALGRAGAALYGA